LGLFLLAMISSRDRFKRSIGERGQPRGEPDERSGATATQLQGDGRPHESVRSEDRTSRSEAANSLDNICRQLPTKLFDAEEQISPPRSLTLRALRGYFSYNFVACLLIDPITASLGHEHLSLFILSDVAKDFQPLASSGSQCRLSYALDHLHDRTLSSM
jgi:hypothetical protein